MWFYYGTYASLSSSLPDMHRMYVLCSQCDEWNSSGDAVVVPVSLSWKCWKPVLRLPWVMVVTFMSDLEIKDFILHGSWYHTILLLTGQCIMKLMIRVAVTFTKRVFTSKRPRGVPPCSTTISHLTANFLLCLDNRGTPCHAVTYRHTTNRILSLLQLYTGTHWPHDQCLWWEG